MGTQSSSDAFIFSSKSDGAFESTCFLCPDYLVSAKKNGVVKVGGDYVVSPDKGVVAVLVGYDEAQRLFHYHRFKYARLCAQALVDCGIEGTPAKGCCVEDKETEFISKEEVLDALLAEGFTVESPLYLSVQRFLLS